MPKVHVLWAQEESLSYRSTIPVILLVDGSAAGAIGAKAIIDKCEPKLKTHITEVEFFGTLQHTEALPKQVDNGSPFEGADYDPPPDDRHPLVALAQQVVNELEG